MQALHANSCFSCAACGGRRTFPEFEQLVLHIHSLHMVTDSEMVRETILLPESGPGALKVFRCGVTNCGVTFTAQPELVLRAHMEAVHGSYYVKLGKGKYLLRFCRICGEERCFTTENELLAHISTCHPPEQFGQRLSDGEEETETEVKQEVLDEEVSINNNPVRDIETLSSGLMNEVGNRPRNVEISPSQGPSTSSVLVQEAIELAAKTTPPGPSPKEGKEERKRKWKKKKHVDSTSEEFSESSSDYEEHTNKRKKKSKKSVKEKAKKKAPIEEKKKKFKEQVGKMSPEEIKQHILKMKEKADKLLKKKAIKEKDDSGASKKKSSLPRLPAPKEAWPRTINDKTAHYFCLVCNIYAGKQDRWLLHREQVEHIEAYSSTKEDALQRHDCAEIDLQECVIGEDKFEKNPIGQCRECFQVGNLN